MPKSWECNPTNTPTHLEMWSLNQPSDWRITSAKLVRNGANVIRTLTTKETMATTKHFYPNEDDGCQHFF